VGGEGSRSTGLVNCSLVTDYTLRYRSSVQVDRQPDEGLSGAFGELLIAFNL
jgi:hypothetical protein